jgi:very-short-patch-repair endonuclease
MTMLSLRNAAGIARARNLRSNMTQAERRLWYHLRDRRFDGWKFRRQVSLGDYVVDFICQSARLIIEVDGGQHMERRDADATRTAWLDSQGYRVLRFWNNDVLGNLDGVAVVVMQALMDASSPRPSP